MPYGQAPKYSPGSAASGSGRSLVVDRVPDMGRKAVLDMGLDQHIADAACLRSRRSHEKGGCPPFLVTG